jgi:hypothetical protein
MSENDDQYLAGDYNPYEHAQALDQELQDLRRTLARYEHETETVKELRKQVMYLAGLVSTMDGMTDKTIHEILEMVEKEIKND